MAIYVNTNVGGIRGRNQLNSISSQLDTTYQRLSSGLRINSAKDDAAGLAISDRMTSQINGLQQGNRNAADAVALLQTIEGGYDEATSALQQIRTLAVQASNGTNTADDRKSLGAQVYELAQGITSIASSTKFGGKTILNGADSTSIYSNANGNDTDTAGTITFQIGANGGDTIADFEVTGLAADGGLMTDFHDALKATTSNPTTNLTSVDGCDFGTPAALGAFIGAVDSTLQAIDAERGKIGATQNRLESTMRNQSNVIANQSDARSRIRDTDFAEESAKLSQQNIIQQASMSMLMQANARPQMALSLLG